MKEELGEDAKVIGTGGYAEIIGRETDVIDSRRTRSSRWKGCA